MSSKQAADAPKDKKVHKTDKKDKKRYNRVSKHLAYTGQSGSIPFFGKRSYPKGDTAPLEWKKREIYSNVDKYEVKQVKEEDMTEEELRQLVEERRARRLEHLETLIRMNMHVYRGETDHEWNIEYSGTTNSIPALPEIMKRLGISDESPPQGLDLSGILDNNWLDDDFGSEESDSEAFAGLTFVEESPANQSSHRKLQQSNTFADNTKNTDNIENAKTKGIDSIGGIDKTQTSDKSDRRKDEVEVQSQKKYTFPEFSDALKGLFQNPCELAPFFIQHIHNNLDVSAVAIILKRVSVEGSNDSLLTRDILPSLLPWHHFLQTVIDALKLKSYGESANASLLAPYFILYTNSTGAGKTMDMSTIVSLVQEELKMQQDPKMTKSSTSKPTQAIQASRTSENPLTFSFVPWRMFVNNIQGERPDIPLSQIRQYYNLHRDHLLSFDALKEEMLAIPSSKAPSSSTTLPSGASFGIDDIISSTIPTATVKPSIKPIEKSDDRTASDDLEELDDLLSGVSSTTRAPVVKSSVNAHSSDTSASGTSTNSKVVDDIDDFLDNL